MRIFYHITMMPLNNLGITKINHVIPNFIKFLKYLKQSFFTISLSKTLCEVMILEH